MFVSELDRPWLETPFLMEGLLIETQEHLNLVRELCEFVYVDAVQERYVPPEERALLGRKKEPRYIHQVSFEHEQGKATSAYSHAKQITKSVMDEVRLGNALDEEQAKASVNDCVDSIIRNPDVLMWIDKIKSVSSQTADHSLTVSLLAITFGRYLDYEIDDLQKLGLCGLLHDIGMMKVPREILQKETPLDDAERKTLESHAVHGRDILLSSKTIYHGVTDVAHCHHEHLDGTGYPRGIKAVGISPFTRIVAIVDRYDSITTATPGKPAKSSLTAMRELYSVRGKELDADLVLQFIQCVGLYPPGSVVELMNGSVGIVISTNYKNRRLPKVLVLLNPQKRKITPRVVNLAVPGDLGENKEMLIKDVLIDGEHGIFLKEHLEQGLKLA